MTATAVPESTRLTDEKSGTARGPVPHWTDATPVTTASAIERVFMIRWRSGGMSGTDSRSHYALAWSQNDGGGRRHSPHHEDPLLRHRVEALLPWVGAEAMQQSDHACFVQSVALAAGRVRPHLLLRQRGAGGAEQPPLVFLSAVH